MSDREVVYQLLDSVPDNKISYIIGYIQGLIVEGSDTPNVETIAAIQETDEMIEKGAGQHFEGSAKDFINKKTDIEEVEPDEWDLKMIEDAKANNDGSTISLDELLKKEGLTYADL